MSISALDQRSGADVRVALRRAATPLPVLLGAVGAATLVGVVGAVAPSWDAIVWAVLVGPWVVAAAVSRPAWVLAAVVTLSPFDPLFFGALLKSGAAHDILALSRFWKEAAVLALGAAAVVRGWGRNDFLDWIALAVLAIVLVYLVAPLGPSADVRLVAARQDGFMLLLFITVRRLHIDASARRLLAMALLVEGAITTATGLWNVFDPAGWNGFLAGSGVLAYQAQQAGGITSAGLVYGVVGGRVLLHASGLFFSSLSFGFFMLVPLAIATSGTGLPSSRLLRLLAICSAAAGVVLSLTRTAIFAMLAMFGAAILLANRRVAALTSGVFVALVLVPLASAVALNDRLATTLAPTDASSTIHIERLGYDAAALLAAPLGHGLGTAASTGARFGVPGAVINESWYFQIGSEMGILAFVLIVALVLACLTRLLLGALARDSWSLAGFLVLAATGASAVFLHTYDAIGVAWPVWTLVGLGCRAKAKSLPAERPTAPLRENLTVSAPSAG